MRAPNRVLPSLAYRAVASSVRRLAHVEFLRHAAVAACEKRLRADSADPAAHPRHPPSAQADRLALGLALLRLVERALAEDRLNDATLRGLVERLLGGVILHHADQSAKQEFHRRRGCNPPDFLTISPCRTCNLRCVGCYAASGPTPEKLDWATLDRLVSEAHDLWGMRFFVLSGGEPFAYRDDGKGILELAEKHQDCFFLSYSNGTLITDDVAKRLGQVGNLSPGLSVEGMRERTDARRGHGVFDKVLAAMERLRREKVVFGVSLTATRENADEILCDDLVELFFDRMGAFYSWVFHYMPIGRGPTLSLMPTPEQRLRLFERVWHLVRERRLFIADFWNSATATNGCVAGGRTGGYFYVDWNGAVCPCVFVPYSPVNIRDLYARGGTLDDVWEEPFFAGFRSWQRGYGYRGVGERYDGGGNWLMPCLIRDHHRAFRRLVDATRPEPADADARDALADPEYARGLYSYDEKLAELADPVWRERFQGRRRGGG